MESNRDRIIKEIRQLPNVNPALLDEALVLEREHKAGLITALIKSGVVTEQHLLIILMQLLHIPCIDLTKYRFDEKLKSIIDGKTAKHYGVMPLSAHGDTLTIALADPLNLICVDDLRNLTGKHIDIVLSSSSQIQHAIETFYAKTQTLAAAAQHVQDADFELVEESKGGLNRADAEGAEEAPVIRMVNLVVKEAIRQRASDIHMEPSEQGMRVRFRIDGVLQDILIIPKETQNSVAVRLKIMSRLDITATQIPQDGRFKMRLASQEIDFRVSMLPTTFGQKIVMRILDRGNLSVGLSKLGFSPRSMKLMEEAIYKPFGMILVTGPTGSGKSTTLYSLINKLNTPDRNIITIEDPVEYLVDGLTQIEVKHDIGLNFAVGLKAVLRQSPDIVMVGEIRDAETADIAIKASLTGQLVLSTLHTNDAAGSLTRLVDMGLESFLVASSLIMVCAQRLCRRICPYCKKPIDVPKEAYAKIAHLLPENMVFYEGKGCERCRGTGFHGRLGITEILIIDDEIRAMLIGGKTSLDIARHACKSQGMRLLFEDAIDKMAQGLTTLTEVYRVSAQEQE